MDKGFTGFQKRAMAALRLVFERLKGSPRLPMSLIVVFGLLALGCKAKEMREVVQKDVVKPKVQTVQDVQEPKAPSDPGPVTQEDSGKRPVDKDKLWACYKEVYCAQKRNEMDKILDIYKGCGFQKPEEFTEAWIEAAKDTEWVSRLAQEVSKACK